MESTDAKQSIKELRGATKANLNRKRQKSAFGEPNFRLTAPQTLDVISCMSQIASLENVQNLVWNKLDWKSLKNATLVKQR